jgi:thiamine biosynthesis protein ThiS
MPNLTVNGQPRPVEQLPTVTQLVRQLGLAGKPVAVEVNRRLVPRKQHEQTQLKEGDVVEIVTLVGGG